jgi:hypothetical protein
MIVAENKDIVEVDEDKGREWKRESIRGWKV